MTWEKVVPQPHRCDPGSGTVDITIEAPEFNPGAGSVWRCDICGTRWILTRYDGWEITPAYRRLQEDPTEQLPVQEEGEDG